MRVRISIFKTIGWRRIILTWKKNAFVLQQVKFTDVKPARLPLFDRTIIFKIHAPKLYEGEAVALLGKSSYAGQMESGSFPEDAELSWQGLGNICECAGYR